MATSVAIHIVGLTLWLGGLITVTTFIKRYSPQGQDQWFYRSLKAAFFGYCLPGLVLSLLTGLYQLSLKGVAYYFSQGWFHMKLTLVFLLLLLTVFVFMNVNKITKGGAIHSRQIVWAQFAISLLLVLTVVGTFHGIR